MEIEDVIALLNLDLPRFTIPTDWLKQTQGGAIGFKYTGPLTPAQQAYLLQDIQSDSKEIDIVQMGGPKAGEEVTEDGHIQSNLRGLDHSVQPVILARHRAFQWIDETIHQLIPVFVPRDSAPDENNEEDVIQQPLYPVDPMFGERIPNVNEAPDPALMLELAHADVLYHERALRDLAAEEDQVQGEHFQEVVDAWEARRLQIQNSLRMCRENEQLQVSNVARSTQRSNNNSMPDIWRCRWATRNEREAESS